MINLASMFDSYGRQARLYPGLLTLFPPLLAAIAWVPSADIFQHRRDAADHRVVLRPCMRTGRGQPVDFQ
jgi:hypothetical protein